MVWDYGEADFINWLADLSSISGTLLTLNYSNIS
jgi:hypothetical protein